jgi:hypothetical protein
MMKTQSSCCGGATDTCSSTIAELPRYYPRQLITPDDLTLEQNYFRDRMRRHNRLLHGWGVVCGALVCPVTTKDANGAVSLLPWQVQVQKGYVLGPYGDEIILDFVRTVDLRTNGVSGVTGDPCIDVPDPWCSQVSVPRTTGTLYIAVKYKQSMTRPVRVQPTGCGCSDNSCECSRLHDGYEIGILPCCPDDKDVPPSPQTLFTGDIPDCTACPSQPWVVLAAVQVDADGTVSSVDNCECRRLVGSLAGFWWKCKEDDITVTGVDPQDAFIGQSDTLMVSGTNLDQGDTYSFGNGIMVKGVTPTTGKTAGTSMDVVVQVDSSAQSGSRTLVVMDQHCRTVTLPGAIKVTAQRRAVGKGKEVAQPAAPQAKDTSLKGSATKTGKKQTPATPGQ